MLVYVFVCMKLNFGIFFCECVSKRVYGLMGIWEKTFLDRWLVGWFMVFF